MRDQNVLDKINVFAASTMVFTFFVTYFLECLLVAVNELTDPQRVTGNIKSMLQLYHGCMFLLKILCLLSLLLQEAVPYNNVSGETNLQITGSINKEQKN
jgi:hypothetical protein